MTVFFTAAGLKSVASLYDSGSFFVNGRAGARRFGPKLVLQQDQSIILFMQRQLVDKFQDYVTESL